MIYGNEIALPAYKISPYEIFSNKIPLFDVDFFNPSASMFVDHGVESKEIDSKTKTDYGASNNYQALEELINSHEETKGLNINAVKSELNKEGDTYSFQYKNQSYLIKYVKYEHVVDHGTSTTNTFSLIGAQESEKTEVKSTAAELKSVVATWYKYLRDIAIVMLLSILVYVGIRIIISSASQDKAKYKQMLVDWLVAMCLIFIMQYIMSFSNLIVKKIINIFSYTTITTVKEGDKEYTGEEKPKVFIINDEDKVKKAYELFCMSDGVEIEGEYNKYFTNSSGEQANPNDESGVTLSWPTENFLEQARLEAQIKEGGEEQEDSYTRVGYNIIYILLVIMTFVFVYQYLKRVIYMTFLTMIAPLVAMTYPIDKMNDGQAQAFNMWFKEYIFNLLIQPMHLLLYTVLVGSAMAFATQNLIYVVVAMGFMVPAEKLIRKMFGFEKAQTSGMLNGAIGAGLAMKGMQNVFSKIGGNGGKGKNSSASGGGKSDGGEDAGNKNIRTVGFDELGDGSGAESKENAKDKNNENYDEYLKQQNEELGLDEENGFKNAYTAEEREEIFGNKSTVKGKEDNAGTRTTSNNSNSNDKKKIKSKPSKPRRLWNAAVRSGHYYGRGLRKKAAANMKALPGQAIRTAKGVGLAGLGAAGGAMLGLATDPSKINDYALAGGVAGYAAGNSSMGIADALKVEGVKDVAKQAYYTKEELEQKDIKKQQKRIKKDLQLRYKLEDELGDKDKAEKLIDMCSEYGMDDAKEMLAVNKVMEKHQDARNNPKRAIKAVQMAKEQRVDNLNAEEKAKRIQSYQEAYRSRGIANAEREGENLFEMARTASQKLNKG